MHDSAFRAPPEYCEHDATGGFHKLIGPFYIKGDGSEFRYGFRADTRHINPAGIIHGGLLMTIMDMVLTTTVIHVTEAQNHVSTISLNCDFLAPITADTWIEGRGEVTRRTRALAFVCGRLQVDGQDVVTATGVWRIFSAPLRATAP